MTEYQYTFTKGQISYTLSIAREEGRYRGKYTCPVCETTIPVDREFACQQDAVMRLQIVIYA